MDEHKVPLLYWINGGWCFEHDFVNVQDKRYKRSDAFEVMVELFASDEDIIDIVEWKLNGDNTEKKETRNINGIIEVITSITVIVIVLGIIAISFI